MLEPAVRPGAVSGGVTPAQGKPPFEQQSFDQLLQQADQRASETDGDSVSGDAKPSVDPLAALGGLGQVENAALRNVLAQARGAGGDDASRT